MNKPKTISAPVLDACCGSRMFWFDRADGRALFVDKRRENCVADTREGRREIVVNPDTLADFKSLPFADNDQALPQGGAKKGNDEH